MKVIPPYEKSFASHERSKYWSSRNEQIPRNVYRSTKTKYWFDCDKCSHSFEKNLCNIQKDSWCPYCTNQKLCDDINCLQCNKNSFASHDKAYCWSKKNGDITPRQVFKSANKKYWLNCDKCSHAFDMQLNNVTTGYWCPYCCEPSQKLCEDMSCTQCMTNSFESNCRSNCWSKKNGDITPRQVFKSGSIIKYWFDCEKCSHSFDVVLGSVTNGTWCPYCTNQVLCDDVNFIQCKEKSFTSHEKSQYWSCKNENITPRNVFKSSGNKYWFDCIKCNHLFYQSLDRISRGRWCMYCSNTKLCNDINCRYCFENSFESHEKSKNWSKKNGDIVPRQVFKSANTKYWFECDKCNHSFDMKLNAVTNGGWCSYCSVPPKKLCENMNCDTCFAKSFASHAKSKYWSKQNGEVLPRHVFKSSGNKYWFDCDNCGHSFNVTLNAITSGRWCSQCKYKTERKIYETLLPLYPTIVKQFKQDWCKNINHLPFDFCLPEDNIIIELDGAQHFKQVSNWQPPEKTVETDKYKEQCANNNNYSVIRILQEDVLFDKYDWIQLLCNTIENIKHGDDIVNIYLCKKNEYDNHF